MFLSWLVLLLFPAYRPDLCPRVRGALGLPANGTALVLLNARSFCLALIAPLFNFLELLWVAIGIVIYATRTPLVIDTQHLVI